MQTELSFVDTTLRDGNQSLWGATGLRTGMMLEIASDLDRVGYHAIDFTTSTHMAVAVRFHKEDPWERIRLMKARMPRTPLTFMGTGMRFISWEAAHPELLALAYRLLVRAGIERFQILDPMNQIDATIAACQQVRAEAGESVEIVAGLVYTVSPFHDDQYYAGIARQVAESKSADRIYLKDPGGLLTPERARTLVPAIHGAIGGVPLELHSHNTIALAQFTYLDAPGQGVQTLHTAARPLGNGTSQPSIERVASNFASRSLDIGLDMEAQARVSTYFERLAAAEGLRAGEPQDFDDRYFRHQLPGGMLGTMQRQLGEMRQQHRLAEVFDEVERVRAELGFPIMVTPFSQVVGTMSVMNVLAGERYANVPDEVIRYVLGRFGAPPAPLDQNVRDRILSMPRTRELASAASMPDVAELRRLHGGRRVSDEQLVLRAVMPGEQVEAMLAAGPMRTTYSPTVSAVQRLLGELSKRPDVTQVGIEKPTFKLSLKAAGVGA